MKHEQAYFTKAEAAEYLRCSQRTIDYARERSELKAFRLEKKNLLFARDDLDAFVHRRSANADLDKIVAEVVSEVVGDAHRK